MSDRKPRAYSIGELAQAAGVSRRTVRYYVQRGVIPAPVGRGRGAHYTDEHLRLLLRARQLQRHGVPLDEVGDADPVRADHVPDHVPGTSPGVAFHEQVPGTTLHEQVPGTPPAGPMRAVVRVALVEGLVLEADLDRLPSADQLMQIATACHQILSGPQRAPEDETSSPQRRER